MQNPEDMQIRAEVGNQINRSNTPADEADYEAELRQRRKTREYQGETWFYWVRLVIICTIAALSLSLLIIYWWHLAAGENWRWLDKLALDRIEKVAIAIVVGIGGTLSVTYFMKR